MMQSATKIKPKLKALLAPEGFSDYLLVSLKHALEPLAEFFSEILLAKADYEDGKSSYVLVLVGVDSRGEAVFLETIQTVVENSTARDQGLDVSFVAPDDPGLNRIRKVCATIVKSGPTQ